MIMIPKIQIFFGLKFRFILTSSWKWKEKETSLIEFHLLIKKLKKTSLTTFSDNFTELAERVRVCAVWLVSIGTRCVILSSTYTNGKEKKRKQKRNI